MSAEGRGRRGETKEVGGSSQKEWDDRCERIYLRGQEEEGMFFRFNYHCGLNVVTITLYSTARTFVEV